MTYEIRTKSVPSQSVVTMRMHASLPDIGLEMRKTIEAIGVHVHPKPSAILPFAIYHNEPFRPEDVDVEMGLPIEREAIVDADSGGLRRREIPAGTVAYTVHLGTYGRIGAAYQALFDWMRRTGHRLAGVPREIYIVGPDEAHAPDHYITEIEVPIADVPLS